MTPRGYHDERRAMSVAPHGGDWILRSVQPGDRPISESLRAASAMAGWMARNRAKFAEGAAK